MRVACIQTVPSSHLIPNILVSAMAVFWVFKLCSVVEVYRHFRGLMAIALKTEAANTSETSVNFYRTIGRVTNQKTAICILAARQHEITLIWFSGGLLIFK
jgi:hypothetical protein